MTVYKTIADLQKKVEEAAQNQGSGAGRFFVIKSGENYRIRFRQEVAEDGTMYDAEKGTATVVPVHTSALNFRRKALCTSESEAHGFKCWACEQLVTNRKWKPQPHLLTNVLVLIDGDWVPKVLDQTFNQRHISNDLIQFAAEYSSVMDRDYRISRQGEKLSTNYTLIPLDTKPMPEEHKTAEMFDLDKVFVTLPYEEQADFYMKADDDASPTSVRNDQKEWAS